LLINDVVPITMKEALVGFAGLTGRGWRQHALRLEVLPQWLDGPHGARTAVTGRLAIDAELFDALRGERLGLKTASRRRCPSTDRFA